MPARLPFRLVALVAAALATGGLLTAAPAQAAPTAHPRAAAARQVAGHRTAVLLPTGETVAYDPAAPRDLRVRTRVAKGPGAAWRSFTTKKHTYVVPLAASRFLGGVLDPSLFDVTAAAAAAESRSAITVGVAAGSRAAVPGLTVTGRSKTVQHGYFTAAGARRFGAALLSAAQSTRGRTTPTRSLFGAASISRTGKGHVLSPEFPQQTVIFRVTGPDGQPLPEGLLFYGNLDDAARASGFAEVVDGEVRVSLPAGSYTLLGDEADFVSDTSVVEHVVTTPQLAVTGAANQVVDVDFRTATSTLSFTGPVPTDLQQYAVIYDREWDTGGLSSVDFGDSSLTVEVAPAPAPSIGTAALDTYWQAVPTSGSAEEYDAAFQSSGAIDADQAYSADASEFGNVQEHFFPASSTAQAVFAHGILFGDGDGVGAYSGITPPLSRLDHLLTPADAGWQDDLLLLRATEDVDVDPVVGEVSDEVRTYPAGTTTTASWLQQAVAPAVPTLTDADADGSSCSACRTAKQLVAVVVPVQDTFGTGHFGFVADPRTGQLAARLRLYRDGKLVKDVKHDIVVTAAVPTKKATYRLVADSTPSVLGFRFGGTAQTQWTFTSSSSSGAPLPYGAECSASGKGTCRILPMLQIRAPLPTGLDDTMSVGSHVFPLCVAPIQGARVQVAAAAGQVSYDGGRTYRSIDVAGGTDGCYDATITNPAGSAGRTALVRFTATGSGGSSVVQTVRDAYRVTD